MHAKYTYKLKKNDLASSHTAYAALVADLLYMAVRDHCHVECVLLYNL